MAEVFVSDEQTADPVDVAHIRALAQHVLDNEGVAERAEVSLMAVDQLTIADLNKRFLGKEGPTDVLAFPIDEADNISPRHQDEPVLLGDVILCPSVARLNAPEHTGTYDAEMDLLVVHGLLHLLGYDHQVDVQAEKMEGREKQLLASFTGAES